MNGVGRAGPAGAAAMRKHSMPTFSMNDPAMGLMSMFRPLQKLKFNKRPKLDLVQEFDGATIRWRGPDLLSIPEQTLWLTLVALAAVQKAPLTVDSCEPNAVTIRAQLELGGLAGTQDVALLQCRWSALARACRMSSTDSKVLKQLKQGLKRLSEVTVWLERDGITKSTRLLSWLVGDDYQVHVALNWRIAAIIFAEVQYARVCLDERAQLKTDAAKALHAWVSATLREGREWRFGIDTLSAHIFGDAGAGAQARDRRRRTRVALAELNTLPRWSAPEIAGVATIRRPPREIPHAPREIKHVPRENAHAHPGAFNCNESELPASANPLLGGSTNRLQGKPYSGGTRRLKAPPGSIPRSPHVGGEEQEVAP